MPRPIGYYVHHQGAGHLHRALLIAGALKRPCTLIGTFEDDAIPADAVFLPDDRIGETFEGRDGTASRPEAFHYAPVGHIGVRSRMTRIAAWVAAHDPALMVVDVSVEVALFARLLSVPVALVRLAGRRDDRPHLEAFRAAEILIAPFPAAFEGAHTPAWVRAKTIYVGFLAELTCRHTPPVPFEIAVVSGRGGDTTSATSIADAARATPTWTWQVYGITSAANDIGPSNLRFHGWVPEIGAVLDRAAIVVGGAGDGLLAAVVARGKRFVCVPARRPFDEQVDKAEVLAGLGVAVVLEGWPKASEWPAVLDRAMTIDGNRLRALHNPHAIAETAAAIDMIASRFDR